jgi:polyphosphate kinase
MLDVIAHHLEELFPNMEELEVVPFRVTRNAEVELEEGEPVDSVADRIEEELRLRRLEDPVRLEHAAGASRAMLTLLAILYAAMSDTFSKVWKVRVRRESMAALCFPGRSSRHPWMAALNPS